MPSVPVGTGASLPPQQPTPTPNTAPTGPGPQVAYDSGSAYGGGAPVGQQAPPVPVGQGGLPPVPEFITANMEKAGPKGADVPQTPGYYGTPQYQVSDPAAGYEQIAPYPEQYQYPAYPAYPAYPTYPNQYDAPTGPPPQPTSFPPGFPGPPPGYQDPYQQSQPDYQRLPNIGELLTRCAPQEVLTACPHDMAAGCDMEAGCDMTSTPPAPPEAEVPPTQDVAGCVTGDPSQGPVKGEPSKGEPEQVEPSKGQPSKGEPTQGTPTQGEPSKGEPTTGVPKQEPSKGDPVQQTPPVDSGAPRANYEVKQGDSLSAIAEQLGNVTWEQLYWANRDQIKNPDLIYPGQVLKVPASDLNVPDFPYSSGTSNPPKAEPPKAEPPKAEPPKVEPPKVEPPKVEPPKAEPPKVEPPKAEPPKAEPPTAPPAPPSPPPAGQYPPSAPPLPPSIPPQYPPQSPPQSPPQYPTQQDS